MSRKKKKKLKAAKKTKKMMTDKPSKAKEPASLKKSFRKTDNRQTF